MNLPVPYTFANGDGSTTNFPLTFPYLSKEHIKVRINGILTTSFTWINSSTIQITPAPSIGVNNVKIYRDTPHNDKLVSFAGNVSLRPSDLETDSLQAMYILQELEELQPSDGSYARANGAFVQANAAFNQANAAYTQANVANSVATSAGLRANTLVTDNVPETSSNLYFTGARVRANVSNVAPINYDSSTGLFSHADSGVTATTYGNSSFVSQVTIDAQGHVTSVSNVAIDQTLAQSSFNQANAAYTQANTKVSKSGDTMTGTLTTPTVLASNIGIGGVSPSLAILQADGDIYTTAGVGFYQTGDGGARNVLYRGGTDFTVLRNFNQPYTVLQVWSPPGSLSANGESTIALVRGNEPDQEFIDVYNNGYASETQFGIRIQKRGTGVYRDFIFDQYDGVTKTPIMNLTSSGAVVIGSDPGGSDKLRVNGTVNVTSTVSAADPTTAKHLTTKSWVDAQVASKVANNGVTVNGSILIGNTVSGGFDLTTLTQGTGIALTNDKGAITIAATGGSSTDQFARDQANGAFTQANGISRCITVPSPVVTDNISFFFTNKPITFSQVVSVVRGTTPNVTFLLSYESSRHVGATRTNIINNTVCSNTTNGVFTTTFANATVPANNYVTLTFSTVTGTVSDIHISMFGSL